MTELQEVDQLLRGIVGEIQRFMELSLNALDTPGRAFILSVGHYMKVRNKSLVGKCDANSCVSMLDVVESEIEAFSKCLGDLQIVRNNIIAEEHIH